MRYVGPGKHTLLRLVYYKSGQQVIVTDTVDRGYADEIVKYVFLSFLYGQKTWLQVVLGLLVFALFWFGVVWIVHVLYRRHLWKVMHFLKYQRRPGNTVAQQPLRSGLTPLHIVRTDELLRLVLRRGIPALFVLASLLVVLSLANNFVAQPYRVDGLSMRDTLEDGNTLLVNRLGPTIAKLGIKPYLPERGEIVVVEHSEELVPGTETKTNIVKRVVALPGERVTVNQDGIRVYNQEHPDGFDPDKAWRETMHVEGTEQPGQYLPYGIDITLGPGELFICGDNRSQSDDSRVFGPILADAVVGKAFVRLYPFSLQ
jgi:signal peptidase I